MVSRTFKPVRNQIPLLVNLPERLLGGSIHLELKDIDPVFGPAHRVRPPDGGLHLGLGVVPKQREDRIDDRLEMFFRLVLKIVRDPGKERLHPFQGPIDVIVFQGLIELEHE